MLFSLQAICACQVSSFLQHSISNRRRSRKNQDPSKWLCAVSIDAGPSHKKYYSRASGQDVNISYLSFYSGITQRVEMIDLNCLLPYWNYDIDTVFENPTKRYHSTLRAKRATFTFLVDKSKLKMPKMFHFGEFLKT